MISYTLISRFPSVVEVAVQVTVTVNGDKEPASEDRFVGDAGQVGITTGEQVAGFSVLLGSSTWYAPHSIPARAAW